MKNKLITMLSTTFDLKRKRKFNQIKNTFLKAGVPSYMETLPTSLKENIKVASSPQNKQTLFQNKVIPLSDKCLQILSHIQKKNQESISDPKPHPHLKSTSLPKTLSIIKEQDISPFLMYNNKTLSHNQKSSKINFTEHKDSFQIVSAFFPLINRSKEKCSDNDCSINKDIDDKAPTNFNSQTKKNPFLNPSEQIPIYFKTSSLSLTPFNGAKVNKLMMFKEEIKNFTLLISPNNDTKGKGLFCLEYIHDNKVNSNIIYSGLLVYQSSNIISYTFNEILTYDSIKDNLISIELLQSEIACVINKKLFTPIKIEFISRESFSRFVAAFRNFMIKLKSQVCFNLTLNQKLFKDK